MNAEASVAVYINTCVLRFVELLDCGHCFTYEGLDTWFNQTDNESNSKIDIKLKECPRCKTPVWRSTRYGQIVNRQLQ